VSSLASLSTLDWAREMSATENPSRPKRRAVAWPSPEPAPMIAMVLMMFVLPKGIPGPDRGRAGRRGRARNGLDGDVASFELFELVERGVVGAEHDGVHGVRAGVGGVPESDA